MEPPIGYGSTHRSIFPESQFRTDGGSVFQGAVVEHRHKVRTTNAFLVAALIPVITGTGIGGTEEL